MAYQARVYEVMIASPSDVPNERRLAADIVREWSDVHSKKEKIVLMPVRWETHSSPAMGARAQEIINKQILKDADLLIAVFWTKLGSPTGSSPSGTVEEIEEHIAAGKPAMIYFSSQPVQPESIVPDQYQALQKFKEKCKSQGLIEEYESLGEFQEKLSRQLPQTIIRDFLGDANRFNEVSTTISFMPQQPAIPEISEAARELLLEAVKDKNGTILRLPTMGGLRIRANDREFTQRTPRSAARWEAALQELVAHGFIREQQSDRGLKQEVFQVTEAGYQAADSLEKLIPRAPETENQRKARKILREMKDKIITLRWLNTPSNSAILGRVKGEAEMMVRDCSEDTVSLENLASNTRQSLSMENILIGVDDERHRPALEVKP